MASHLLGGGLLEGLGHGALAQTVLEAASHGAQVAHAASALHFPALSLDAPVVCTHIRARCVVEGGVAR